jgi:ribosomal protein L37AE/L43A
MLGMFDQEVIFSYCSYCIEREEFRLTEGLWLCDKCHKPLKRATERIDKSLTLNANQGTIVTGDNYG